MKQIILTAGLPGSGKTTTLKKSEYKDFPIVDPDEVKKTLPGYDPKNPHLVHTESLKRARETHLMFLAMGSSFVVDGTGTNVEKYIRWINEAKELDYEVVLLYIKVKVATSLKRNSLRKRQVPVSVIREKAGIINQSTELLGLLCDKFITVEND